MSEAATSMPKSALLLALCALLAVGLLAVVAEWTRAPIAAAQAEAELRALAAVLPPAQYDNQPLRDSIGLLAPAFIGSDEPLRVWRARQRGAAAALVLQAIAPNGYSGAIELLIGVRADGRINGVRVVRHNETPGLGDDIERQNSDWITRFDDRALGDPPPERWRLRRDGGEFDQFAGATLSPRAVVHAVARVLQLVEQHGESLFAAPADAVLRIDGAPDMNRIP